MMLENSFESESVDSDECEGFWMRVPKVPFSVFDKLKNGILKFIIRFCFYHNMKNKIQITDYYFNPWVERDIRLLF